MPEQFRVAVFGEGRAPWRDSRADALADAKALGLASYDRLGREWFIAVPVEIEKRGHVDRVEHRRRDRRGAAWGWEEMAELRALAARGECPRMIGSRMGRTPAAVAQKARRAGVAIGRSA